MRLSGFTKPILIVLCGVVAVTTGFVHYFYNVDSYKTRKVEEKSTVIELTSAFVSMYSGIRKELPDGSSPVPATFRAHAFDKFNKSRKDGRILNVEMVGVPGKAIKIEPRGDDLKKIISSMALQPEPKTWTNIVGARGQEAFRTVRPVKAGKEGCVTCHNTIQAGAQVWKIGDVMGAYVLDVPAAAFLSGLRKQSAILGVFVFVVLAGAAMILMNVQHRVSTVRAEAGRALEREAIEAEARLEAESLAEARRVAEAKASEMADQLSHKNGELANLNVALEDRLKELHEAQDQLIKKGKLAQIGQLTATVAHEIRNPLGAVRTSAFIIERKTKDLDIGVEKPLERVKHGVARCDKIITELLDFTRMHAPQLEQHHVDKWLEDMVREQIDSLPEEVAVELHQALGGTAAYFDADTMQRVIINLLSNASEAMVGKADKPVDNPVENPKIIVASRLSSRGIEISVRDNGPGISAELMEKVLEPLFTTKTFGVGLGLPAVHRILEQHGGGLEVDGGDGTGATFTAWFPARTQVSAAA
ncbi:MAG: DUF3365 domain-containing protein [Rhizobiales bacterium]|nr:DUF3365 domain-containing protein [Hyphomicrobiales bacterium]